MFLTASKGFSCLTNFVDFFLLVFVEIINNKIFKLTIAVYPFILFLFIIY